MNITAHIYFSFKRYDFNVLLQYRGENVLIAGCSQLIEFINNCYPRINGANKMSALVYNMMTGNVTFCAPKV